MSRRGRWQGTLVLACALAMPAVAEEPAEAPGRATPELSAGWEGDEHLGYGYLGGALAFGTDRRDGWGLRASASYLHYRSVDAEGESRVRSPGLFAGAFYRRATARSYLALGAGWEVRRETTAPPLGPERRRTRDGAALQAFALFQPNARSYITAFTGVSSSGGYTWARVALMQQLTNVRLRSKRAWHLGLEFTGHGNEDVVGYQAGLVAEWTEVPDRFAALRFSVGYARREYEAARDEDRLYVGVSLYRNLRPRPPRP